MTNDTIALATDVLPAIDACDDVLRQFGSREGSAARNRWWHGLRPRRRRRQDAATALLETIELTRGLLLDALDGKGITPIIPQLGDPFNSREHQSLPDPEAAPGDVEPPLVVAQLLRTGYRTSDRVLREALVYVRTAADQADTD